MKRVGRVGTKEGGRWGRGGGGGRQVRECGGVEGRQVGGGWGGVKGREVGSVFLVAIHLSSPFQIVKK